MQYYSASEAAALWRISAHRVTILASEGRIPGATKVGKCWLIPQNAQKPIDGRTHEGKKKDLQTDDFRFPILINKDAHSFHPPLTDEELQLRLGQKAFYACDFQQAESTFTTLLENTQNRYIRIATLYYLAYLSQYNIEKQAHTNYLSAMDQELRQDFPHKKDMMLFRFLLEADNGFYHSFVKQLHIDTSQNYHPTSFRSLKVLSLYLLGNGNFTQYSQLRFETFELDCLQMEEEGNYLAAQKLHYLLVEIYQMQLNTAKMRFHLQRGLTIALEQNLFLTPAIDYFYYSAVTKEVLSGFPSDFSRKLQKLGTEIHERYVRFAKKQTEVSYLSALSDKEYAFVTYAVQGYSSKRVAKELNISEKTVSYRYHQIYEKLGIDSKAELVKLIQESQSGSINTR